MLARLALAAACLLPPFSIACAADEPLDLGGVKEEHMMIPMRDGAKLSAFLYFPPGDGPWPVLYEQRYADLTQPDSRKWFAKLAAGGYVVAAENFRGTHLSEGRWVGYRAGLGQTARRLRHSRMAGRPVVEHRQDRYVWQFTGRICAELPGCRCAAAFDVPVHDRHRFEPVS